MVPPIMVGLLVKVFAFRTEPVPSQKYKTKFAAMESALVTVAPVPGTTVLTVSLSVALSFGMCTTGVVPNAPVTVTAALAYAVGLAAGAGFDELQPAMTRQASRGRAMIARKRRMKTSMIVNVSAVSLLCWPGGTTPGTRATGRTHPPDPPL